MKNGQILACLFCLPTAIFAQNYRPFPLGNATWGSVHAIWFTTIVGIEYLQYGDTLVPGYQFSKKLYARQTFAKSWSNPPLDTVYHDPYVLLGALSQDTTAKKVYYTAYFNDLALLPPNIPYTHYPTIDSTILLYDFDLNFFETIEWIPEPYLFSGTTAVQFKDSTWSRRYNFYDAQFESDTAYFWVEGVGGTYGLFTPLVDNRFTDVSTSLACFSEAGVPLYPLAITSCGAGTTSIQPEKIFNNAMHVFPNPSTELIQVEIPTDWLPARLRISDVHGRILIEQYLETSQTELNLSAIAPRALLFVQVLSRGGLAAGKTVVFDPK